MTLRLDPKEREQLLTMIRRLRATPEFQHLDKYLSRRLEIYKDRLVELDGVNLPAMQGRARELTDLLHLFHEE